MASFFLAYAAADAEAAGRVRKDLIRNGFKVWDASSIRVGADWRVSILDGLRDAAAIIVVTTRSSISSEWVQREIAYGLASSKPVIPLSLDGTVLPQLADLQHVEVNADGTLSVALIAYLRGIITGSAGPAYRSDTAARIIEALGNRSISHVVDEVQAHVVLLLGNFAEMDGLAILSAGLQRHGFHPVVFDFTRPKSADYGEMIRWLAGLAGFVVAEMSDPRSVAMELQLIAPQLAVPIVPLIRVGQKSLTLFGDFTKYDWVLETRAYEDLESLSAKLKELVIDPALQKASELRERKRGTPTL